MEITDKAEIQYFRDLHTESENAFELEIDSFQFVSRRTEYLALAEDAKNNTLSELREYLVEIFKILESPDYPALPEDKKELLRMEQFVIFRHLLNNINR